jgi:hypothetical protein
LKKNFILVSNELLDSPSQFLTQCLIHQVNFLSDPDFLIIKIVLLPENPQVGIEEFLVIEITRHFGPHM